MRAASHPPVRIHRKCELRSLKKMLNGLCWDDDYTIAQWLEHRWLQARVSGSNPGGDSHLFLQTFPVCLFRSNQLNIYNKVVSFIIPSFSPIFISSYMGMSKNENEARIYTGGRESARIFLRASSSHYNTIRMYGAVEKCGKQHMTGMQYQNKHVIKLSVRLQLEQPQHLYVLLLSTQFWPQTANVQRLQCESVRAVPGCCDDTEAAVALLRDAFRLRLQMLCDGAIICCHTFVRGLLVQLVWNMLLDPFRESLTCLTNVDPGARIRNDLTGVKFLICKSQ